MRSEEAEIRIALLAHIDVLIEVIDAPDEEGIVWCDGPYDLELPATAPLPAATTKDNAWYLEVVLIAVGAGLFAGIAALIILAWMTYVAFGVLLWLMISSIT